MRRHIDGAEPAAHELARNGPCEIAGRHGAHNGRQIQIPAVEQPVVPVDNENGLSQVNIPLQPFLVPDCGQIQQRISCPVLQKYRLSASRSHTRQRGQGLPGQDRIPGGLTGEHVEILSQLRRPPHVVYHILEIIRVRQAEHHPVAVLHQALPDAALVNPRAQAHGPGSQAPADLGLLDGACAQKLLADAVDAAVNLLQSPLVVGLHLVEKAPQLPVIPL